MYRSHEGKCVRGAVCKSAAHLLVNTTLVSVFTSREYSLWIILENVDTIIKCVIKNNNCQFEKS